MKLSIAGRQKECRMGVHKFLLESINANKNNSEDEQQGRDHETDCGWEVSYSTTGGTYVPLYDIFVQYVVQ